MKKTLILLLCLLGFAQWSAAAAQEVLGEYGIVDSSLRYACPSDLRGMVADWFRSQGLPFSLETGRVVNTITRETVYKSEVISAKLPFWDGRPFNLEIGVADKVVPTKVVVYIPNNAVNGMIGSQGDALAEDLARASLQPFLRQRAKAFTTPCADSSAYVPVFGFDSQVNIPGQILGDFTGLTPCRDAVQELEIFAFAGVRYGELGGCNALTNTNGQNSSANIRQFEDSMRSLGYAKRLSYTTDASVVQGWQQGDKAFIIQLGAFQPNPRVTLLVWRSASFKQRGFAFDGRVTAPLDALSLGDNPACVSRQAQLRQALAPPEKSTYTSDGGCLSLTSDPQRVYAQTRAALEKADYEISEDFSGYVAQNNTAVIYAARAGTARGLQLVIQSQTDGALITWMGVAVNQAVTATRAPFAFDLSVRIGAPGYQLPAYCAENLRNLRESLTLSGGSAFSERGGCLIISAPYPQMLSQLRQAFGAEQYTEEFSQIADSSSFIEFKRTDSSDSYLLNIVPTTQYGAAETVVLWVGINNQPPKKGGSMAKPVPVNRSSPSAPSLDANALHQGLSLRQSRGLSEVKLRWPAAITLTVSQRFDPTVSFNLRPDFGAVSRGTVTRDAVSRGTVTRDAVSRDAVTRDAVSRDAVSRDAVTRGTVTRDAVSRGTATRDAGHAVALEESQTTGQPCPARTRDADVNCCR